MSEKSPIVLSLLLALFIQREELIAKLLHLGRVGGFEEVHRL